MPLDNVALILLLDELPAKTETLPELVSAKSKPENQALDSELGSALFLKAFALSSVSVETVIGPEYFFDDCFGEEPSIV